ncbi:MAG TPA: TadE/TadG family type IV pilus assembly protein [Gemmatimonadales bacterium]|nr:TadE/TadG family type IV pilus assembly protein [Gemmatimonadales bacterium]
MRITRLRAESGQALVEFALLLPFLTMMIFGLIEFGRGIDEKHSLATLSREAALLAARGTSLDSVAQAVIDNGGDIHLDVSGGSIASAVEITKKSAIVRQQVASPGFAGTSRLGAVGDTAAGLGGVGLIEGTTVYVVEVFYNHTPIVPLGRLFNLAVPATLYERAVF